MNTLFNGSEVEMNTFTLMAEDANAYFAPALDLDYDEPNLVVEELEIEFVVADQFVQTVNLPVAPVLVEQAPAKKPVQVRNAA
jgi:hypothetical protein